MEYEAIWSSGMILAFWLETLGSIPGIAMFCPTNCFVLGNNDIYKHFLELNAYKFPVHKLSIDSLVFTDLIRKMYIGAV